MKDNIKETESYKATLDSLMQIGKQIQSLTKEAHKIYSAEVNAIISKNIQDKNQIERTLDRVLDFCSDKDMLLLFKKLCRYYYPIDQVATVNYINFYRELWDSDSLETQNS